MILSCAWCLQRHNAIHLFLLDNPRLGIYYVLCSYRLLSSPSQGRLGKHGIRSTTFPPAVTSLCAERMPKEKKSFPLCCHGFATLSIVHAQYSITLCWPEYTAVSTRVRHQIFSAPPLPLLGTWQRIPTYHAWDAPFQPQPHPRTERPGVSQS